VTFLTELSSRQSARRLCHACRRAPYFLRKATVELTFENSGVAKAWSDQARCLGDGLGDYAKAIELCEVCVCARAYVCVCL
jgi:hypothetical protein